MLDSQIKALVEILRAEMSAIKEAIDKKVNTNAEEETTDGSQKGVEAGLREIADSVNPKHETTTTRYEQAGDQQDRLVTSQRWMTRWTFLAFLAASATAVGAFIYAGIANQQADLMLKTIKQGDRTLEMDQRPWLEFRFGDANSGDSGNVTTRTSPSDPMSVPAQFLNIGKTPAINVSGLAQLNLVPTGREPALPEKWLGGNLPPGGVETLKTMAFFQAPIFPGMHSQFEITRDYSGEKPLPLTADEARALNAKTLYAVVFGRVFYTDIFGVTHWTQFCSAVGVGFSVSPKNCVEYGDVDKNPK